MKVTRRNPERRVGIVPTPATAHAESWRTSRTSRKEFSAADAAEIEA